MPRGLLVYESIDKRMRTEQYFAKGSARFCVAEPTSLGTLLTEFSESGEVLRQEYRKSRQVQLELDRFLGKETKLVKTGAPYARVKVDAECKSCGGEVLRELDTVEPNSISKVPVVPIYICASCKTRYYSMNNEFLLALIEGAPALFEQDELEEFKSDANAFTEKLQATILRIFAMKKIFKLEVRKA
ncbi:MAG: hypothetical protein QXT43_00480 [Candidatus Micrarchaeaceae archaeon]